MVKSKMRNVFVTVVALIATVANAHDLFLRPSQFFIQPDSSITVPVLNGTFSKSENAITRDRLADVSLVGPDGRQPIDLSAWTERDPSSSVTVKVSEAGSYVIGAAVRPRMLSMKGPDFTTYLKEEGIDHIVRARADKGQSASPSHERYSKYVKTLLQVGEKTTESYGTVLGYAAEIVPLANPGSLHAGATLTVRCLVDGKPLARYIVVAGGRKGTSAIRLPQQRQVTDDKGEATFTLTTAGAWYVKFVHMVEMNEPDVQYESKWATLTFGVR